RRWSPTVRAVRPRHRPSLDPEHHHTSGPRHSDLRRRRTRDDRHVRPGCPHVPRRSLRLPLDRRIRTLVRVSASVREETSTRVENDPRWANPEAARQALCDQLEAEGAQWVGIINAATAQLAGVIARALQSDAWFGFGINSPQHWAGL